MVQFISLIKEYIRGLLSDNSDKVQDTYLIKEDKSSLLTKAIGINKPNVVLKREIKDCLCTNCFETWERPIKGKPMVGAVLEYDACTKCVNILKQGFQPNAMNNDKEYIELESINYG